MKTTRLTARECDILRLLAENATTESIAQSLHISAATVRGHIRHALIKLSGPGRQSPGAPGDHGLMFIEPIDIDRATGLPGPRYGHRLLSREVHFAVRTGLPLCIALLTLQEEGPGSGVSGNLRRSAQSLKARLRSTDRLVRWEGRTFLLILPGTSPAGAHSLFLRLRQDTNHAIFAGIARWQPGLSTRSLVRAAHDDLMDERLIHTAERSLWRPPQDKP